MNMMLALSFGQVVVTFMFLLICLLLILVVLLQKGRGGGLSGAFGGVGGHSAFGTKTGDVFTWLTVGLTFFFILFAVLGNYILIPPNLNAANQEKIVPEGTQGEGAGGQGAAGESTRQEGEKGTGAQQSTSGTTNTKAPAEATGKSAERGNTGNTESKETANP